MSQLISGKNSVLEAIKYGVPLKRIYVIKPLNIVIQAHVEVIVTNKEHLDKLVHENHQGYVAEICEFNYFNIEEIIKDKPQKIIILDHVQDPHNLGAILRTANAAGIKHLIIPRNRAAKVTSTVLKVASGGQIGLKIIRVNSLSQAVQILKTHHFWIYAAGLSEKAIDLKTIKIFNYPLALIVGNESGGVSQTLLNASDEVIKIAMKGSVQSLNVAVATGIMLFQI